VVQASALVKVTGVVNVASFAREKSVQTSSTT
jgi:hypothetical protein